MIFNSIGFAIFFITVAFLYYFFPDKYKWIWLLLSGIFFYMFAKPVYIIVPVAIILITWFAGMHIGRAVDTSKGRRIYLAAIIANIAILVFFKYTNFFTTAAFDLVNYFKAGVSKTGEPVNNFLLINIAAPLGISYITFQAIGYLVEIKRGAHAPEKHLGHFATFLLFFPKIIAGPVERAHHFLPQLSRDKSFNYSDISSGLKMIVWGLFKKLVIADRLAIYVSAVLDNAGQHSGVTIFVAVILYVFQMYADFSGYTDMALGFAKVLGFDLTQNFDRPLLAKSVTEFWRKWHISLSTWFADYFYNPLAIAKRDWGNGSVIFAFFTTFIVLGFWHGANWTFIVFGALQGCVLTIEFFTRKARKNLRKKLPVWLNNLFGIGFTIGYFALSLIFFRAGSIADAFTIIKRMVTVKDSFYIGNPSVILFSIFGVLFLVLVELKKEYVNGLFTLSNNNNWLIRNCYYCFLVMAILIAGVFDGGEFIYFQF